jgi:glycosyltransferase involved in cell wall biosynthesis
LSAAPRPVKIFINASSARVGGGQTYLTNLLERLPSPHDATVYLLADATLRVSSNAPNLVRVTGPRWLANPLARLCWERVRLPSLLRNLDIDVLFCPGGVVTARGSARCRTVTMFRNMLPFDDQQLHRHPLIWPRLRVWLLRGTLVRSMRSADLVIFVSSWAKEQIERSFAGVLRNSVIIHHGLDSRFRPSSAVGGRPAWLPTGPYLLYVSHLEFYKSQLQVVDAYADFRARSGSDLPLILAGSTESAYARQVKRRIAELGLERHVLLPGNVPYAELPAVYQGAAAVIFASQCENCPNILLESLAAGRPVLSSGRQPMPEFGGDAVLYFEPSEPRALAEELCLVFGDPSLARDLASRALRRSNAFDWETTRLRTWQALLDTARGGTAALTMARA